MLIDATHPEETRVVVVDGNKVEDFDYESINKRQLAGNIYLAKVTRVEPSLQAAFVDYGGNRHGFLAFAEIHPDYYQIPVADREALLAEEEREDQERRAREDEEAEPPSKSRRRRSRSRNKSEDDSEAPSSGKENGTDKGDAAAAGSVVAGLEVIDVLEADEIDAPRGLEIAEPDPDPSPNEADDETEDAVAESAAEPEITEAEPSGEDDQQDAEPTEASEGVAEAVDAPQSDPSDAPVDDEAEEPAPTEHHGEAPLDDQDTGDDAPKTIAESAGLDDEDDQISEDIPGLTKAPKSEPHNDLPQGDAAADVIDASSEETDVVTAETELAEDVADESGISEAATDADVPDAAATEDTPTTDEAAPTDDAPKVETGTDTADADQSVTDPDPEDADSQSTAGEDDTGSEGETEGRQKRSRRRRRRGGKKSDANGGDDSSDAKATDKSDPSGDNDDADDDEDVEDVGADDTLEEAAHARVRLRRKYKIQDVIKVRQILLVQVVKEERGNKGAALTTYLSLAGRYCVLMPNTARGGGISRKITNAGDRKRLREITGELEVPKGMGLIVRTAGAERTRAEIKRDYEFLTRQWEQIRELTLKSIAPTLIYEEGSLIKRSIRDIYSKEIDQIQVEGETGYREAKEYMKMLMPSHAKNVQPYTDPIPLFTRYQVESYLNGMFNPTVQLKSGGYIVIGITEALVAIDVNSGRATKQGSIEETATQTNLEACDEVARQLRLRDLAGLIVIDFIDMDENRNNRAVEKRMKDRLKNDRARIQVGRISAFGLMEMSRQRLRPGMLEATTQPCPHCHGTGLIRSDDSLSLSILREVEEEGVRNRANEITVRVPINVANFLVNHKRENVRQIEERHGISVLILGDSSMISPDYEIERAKTQTRRPAQKSAVISAESAVADAEIIEDEDDLEVEADTETRDGEGKSKRRRGRRGGRRKKNAANGENGSDVSQNTDSEAVDESAEGGREKRRRRGGRGRRNRDSDTAESGETVEAAADTGNADGAADEVDASVTAETSAPEGADDDAVAAAPPETSEPMAADPAEPVVEDVAEETPTEAPVEPEDAVVQEAVLAEAAPEEVAVTEAEPVPAEAEIAAAPAEEAPPKPKRRGWWSLGR
ncbi:MAG: Rne/Rng family ribonuclease [Pseudomonadota bacterium]